MTGILQLTKAQVEQLVSERTSESHLRMFYKAMLPTTTVWGWMVKGEVKCIWGLIPPTLLATEAYLWLEMIEPIVDYEFMFVRHSQKALAAALEKFPQIVGHCEIGADRSIRWIKWLGGKFGEPQGKLIPFVIRRKND